MPSSPTQSFADILTDMGFSFGQLFLIALATLKGYLIRLSNEPPYLSLRILDFGEINDDKAHAIFKNRWGFDYRTARQELPALESTYKNTLIWDFFQHDPINGPLKSFDL